MRSGVASNSITHPGALERETLRFSDISNASISRSRLDRQDWSEMTSRFPEGQHPVAKRQVQPQ